MVKRKLFLSFTDTLFALAHGSVTLDDLATGLFYFGCTRVHALEPWKSDTNEIAWAFREDPELGLIVHAWLVAALLHGETEGRVIWREVDAQCSYEELSALLECNGYGKPLEELSGPLLDRWRIGDALKAQEIPVKIAR